MGDGKHLFYLVGYNVDRELMGFSNKVMVKVTRNLFLNRLLDMKNLDLEPDTFTVTSMENLRNVSRNNTY